MNDFTLKSEDECYYLAEFYKIFGDTTRLKILFALTSGKYCVNHISEKVGMSQSAVSHQLAILRKATVVKQVRAGQSIVYSIADEHVELMLEVALAHIREE